MHLFNFGLFWIVTVATLLFVLPVYVYNTELSVSEILKIAFRLGHKKWGLTFIITLLNTLLIFLMNMLTFGLGGLFLGCFVQIPIYIIYKKKLEFHNINLFNSQVINILWNFLSYVFGSVFSFKSEF